MNYLLTLWYLISRGEAGDRRPRALRRVLPVRFGAAAPLDGHQMARLHVSAYR